MIFENGAGYCNRSQYHKNGKPYYTLNGAKPVKIEGKEITGEIRYTAEQFLEIEKAGIFKEHPHLREVALGGMKEKERYKVFNKKEKKAIQAQWKAGLEHFNKLKFKNLISRGIRGEIAKLYNVRVGLDKEGKVARHYYPVYNMQLEIDGAFCRNLPKDFRSGTIGKIWGECALFGMSAWKEIAKSGAKKRILTITGGACDAMATQQMLLDSKEGTKWEDQLEYVVSVNKGEAALQEIVDNLPKIKKFKKVILAFDNDKAGKDLTAKVAKLLRGKAHILDFPSDAKDPNDCLLQDLEEEFVDAWWNAQEFAGSDIKTPAELREEAIKTVDYGLDWPWPSMNRMTFGIRLHNLYTIGGGSGTGKTEFAKEVFYYLAFIHKVKVGIIFMEEPAWFTLRVIAGKLINKKIHLPKCTVKKGHPDYDESRVYTDEQANEAIDRVIANDNIRIADCKGDTSIDNIMEKCDELRAMGCNYIGVDNLTTINHGGKEGTVKAIDESMRRIGTYMQEQPVAIFLLSHLAKPDDNRIPYEDGGYVRQGDFRGSQSIAFWSTFMIGVERNANGDDEEKLVSTYRCVKDRLTGQHTGETMTAIGNTRTGRLLEPDEHSRNKLVKNKKPKKKQNSKPSKKPVKKTSKKKKVKEF